MSRCLLDAISTSSSFDTKGTSFMIGLDVSYDAMIVNIDYFHLNEAFPYPDTFDQDCLVGEQFDPNSFLTVRCHIGTSPRDRLLFAVANNFVPFHSASST